ncbi:MAG: PIN domain-containing protein [Planctomycetes bacterium]|nr:PIN domain-containing protein [Planctomycetota bacterium]
MSRMLVDSNVILDVMTEDEAWFEWSSEALGRYGETNILVINPVIYAEVSIRFERIEELEAALAETDFERRPTPWEAAFLAGKAFLRYRKRGGKRRSTFPDFFIGAHAAIERMPLITRDPARYRTYFPSVRLIAPP